MPTSDANDESDFDDPNRDNAECDDIEIDNEFGTDDPDDY
ncbi:hypothetical protein KPH14_013134, partial [Odynerus spinipes]